MKSLLWSSGRIWNIVTNPDFLQTGHSDPGLLYLIVVYLWLFIELADYCCHYATEGYKSLFSCQSVPVTFFMYTGCTGVSPVPLRYSCIFPTRLHIVNCSLSFSTWTSVTFKNALDLTVSVGRPFARFESVSFSCFLRTVFPSESWHPCLVVHNVCSM